MVAITLTPKIKNLDKLLAHCHRRRYTAKSTIIYAGDRCETLFFIVKGSVTILIEDDDGREMIIAYLNSGDFFGEMGLFEKDGSEKERSAWVRAKTECEVAEISYAKFRELTQQDPEILFALGSQMAERLQQMQGIVEWGMEGREGGPVMRAGRAWRIGRAGLEEHHRQFLVSVGKPCGRRLRVDRRDGFAGRPDCMNSISARQLT